MNEKAIYSTEGRSVEDASLPGGAVVSVRASGKEFVSRGTVET